MSRVILLNKPFGVICQFSEDGLHPTLKGLIGIPKIYPAGRLDTDSEGLVVLTDDGRLQAQIADPRHKLAKIYWAQVEGAPSQITLDKLNEGVDLGDFVTQPAHSMTIEEPQRIWPRNPPIRYRKAIPTTWLQIKLSEGKNRQVRRMTAKIGYPTLRLIRYAVGDWTIEGLAPGEWRELKGHELEIERSLGKPQRSKNNDGR
ncbi:MAG: pseudouridine synthase [Pseudomonadota bacterium]